MKEFTGCEKLCKVPQSASAIYDDIEIIDIA